MTQLCPGLELLFGLNKELSGLVLQPVIGNETNRNLTIHKFGFATFKPEDLTQNG